METPLAFKLTHSEAPDVYRVKMAPIPSVVSPSGHRGPAIVVVRSAAMLHAVSAGMIDGDDIVAATNGDWSNAILVVLPDGAPESEDSTPQPAKGDEAFLTEVQQSAPSLAHLAQETIKAIRRAGVGGELVKSRLGRWVNQPLNIFTLKAQPRAGNLHFTLYGNPSAYDAGDFLLQDQNSYSRGWVRGPEDVGRLAELARKAGARRKG